MIELKKIKIYVWGTGKLGIYVLSRLFEKGYDIGGFIDSFCPSERKKNFPVFPLYECKENLDNSIVLITAKNSKSVFEILNQLADVRVRKIGIVKPSVENFRLNINMDEAATDCSIIWCESDNVIPRLEVNIIDGCNLNCKGCTHFSSIYAKDSVYDLEIFRHDLMRLRAVGRFVRLRLLGGEPLLVDNLYDYVDVTRNIFPETDIEIVTNGLLIPGLSDEKLQKIKELRAGFIISPYTPTVKIMGRIAEKLDKNRVWWRVEGSPIKEFTRNITLTDGHDGELSAQNCLSAGCTFFRNGKIYKCPSEGLIDELFKYYHCDLQVERSNISIYEEPQKVYESIKNISIKPVSMCSFCSSKLEFIPWQVKKNPVLDDWLYHSN